MIRLLQTRGVTAIACLPSTKELRIGILIITEVPPDRVAAELVNRDDLTAPKTIVFLPEPCEPGTYYDQLLKISPF